MKKLNHCENCKYFKEVYIRRVLLDKYASLGYAKITA